MDKKSVVDRSAEVDLPDELEPYFEQANKRPSFRAAYEDAEMLARTVDSLVSHRHACGLSQTQVAHRMGVRQPTISGFETEGSDPRLSTLQRYARAIGARIRLLVEVPTACDWISPSTTSYRGAGSVSGRVTPMRRGGELPGRWMNLNLQTYRSTGT